MGLIIEDGTGQGNTLKIDSENRMHTDAVAASPEHHTNHVHGQSYTIQFSATPTADGDCFVYVKNTSETDMIIEGFGLKLAADEYIDIKIGDAGTPVDGGSLKPVNLNSGSGNTAEGTFEDGNDITGLSGGSIAYRFYHVNTNGTEYHNFEQDIILKKNGVFTIYCQTGTTALAGFIDLYYHSEE